MPMTLRYINCCLENIDSANTEQILNHELKCVNLLTYGYLSIN